MTEAPALIHLTSPDGRLSVWIAPERGAELCGLEWEGRELLWRGRDFRPTPGWTGRAPILWPAIGRTFAPGPEPTAETFKQAPLGWAVDGVDYPMPMHGFARSLPWQVEEQTPSSLRLVLTDSEQTRAFYPFGFRHTLTYALADDGLTLDHDIQAAETNTTPMPFVLGNHATFRLAANAVLTSNTTRRVPLDPAGRPTGGSVEFTRLARPAAVDTIQTFEVIALKTTGAPPWAKLSFPSAPSITVGVHARDRARSRLEAVTLWGDPSGGYLSLEAWLGLPNALASGGAPCLLASGAAEQAAILIGISAANSSGHGDKFARD
ncbi:hypothetical protein [Brevundimonas sp. NIBR11]|uniref:aldose epimerase family protein n=1 Tax=Brevundimonas sp. NIBR11 TaxID=3015999 RepID=UPI0022F03D0C|nr:hypothetical protein [Brevundimonas sp. NIBR11]WGM30576.1 hypothetical protein KKHFBJBL_00801 [Brevundimonas sp. NIBR11]